ncbi:MAG: hypothetical protein JWR16_132 [Nevskia sp.]|nr:hypothetical protein [Nevskia sp.]
MFLLLVTVYRLLVLRSNGLDLYLDEAQYWTWAQHLQWGYFSKPPVIAGLIAATTAVCGDGVVCVKSGAVLIYPLVSLLIYALARRLFTRPDERGVAGWSALTFFTLPGAAFSAMIISTDVPLFLFWTAALYAYVRAIENNQWRWWLLAGLASGLGLLTKYTMVIFALSVLLHLLTTPGLRAQLRNPKLYSTMLVAAVVFAPNLLWNAQHGWPTLHHTEQISHLNSDAGLHWNHLFEFLGGQFAITGPVLLIAFIVQLVLLRRVWTADPRLRLLACFALPFIAIISLQALLGRANANWGAMTYASATIFSVALLLRYRQRRWLIIGIAFNLVVTIVAYHYDGLARMIGVELTAKSDLYKRVRGWSELGRQAGVLRSQFPQALLLGDSRDVLAELEYYVNPHPLDAVLWNPTGTMDSHYALATTMDDKLGRDFLYVTGEPQLDAFIVGSFDSVESLPPLHVTIHPSYALAYHVWLLQHFNGYRAAAPTSGDVAATSVAP